jgi:hypothetical protein
MWPFNRVKPKRRILLVELGAGNFLVGHTSFNSHPGIVIAPAPNPGPVGEDASYLLPDGLVPDGTIVISFTTPESIQQHRMLLNSMGINL